MQDKTRRYGKQKARTRREPGPGSKGARRAVAPLEFDPFKPGREHPDWVMKKFPTYVEHTHEYLARSTRVLEHRGNTITITTTYEVRLGDRPITLHMMVDEEGRLWSHLCPYLTFATATELVRYLIERMPHLFEPTEPSSGGHAHHPTRARGGTR